LLRADDTRHRALGARSPKQVDDFPRQNQRQNNRPHPHAGVHPRLLKVYGAAAEVEQHHHEDEKHHDRPGIDDHFQGRDKRRSDDKEDDRYRKQRDDQIQKRMHGVEPRQHHEGGGNRHRARKIKEPIHISLN